MQKMMDAFSIPEKRLNTLLHNVRRSGPADYARLRIRALPASRSGVAWFELGDPKGRPLLCLHGLSLSGYFFQQHHERFVELGIRAIAPCLIGGIHIADSAKTIDGLTDDLIELLDLLGIERFDVIGFSWGTLPQLALLARAPERIGKAGLLGPMLPMAFVGPQEVARMKPDIRLSLAMVKHAPMLHHGLMRLVCRMPITALVNQFRDKQLSPAEAAALAPDSAFHTQLSRCLRECIRTGSAFFTHGWRMLLDPPAYALADLRRASQVDVRLYIGERDNVHLPAFAVQIAAAIVGSDVGAFERTNDREDRFDEVFSRGRCGIWMSRGAGRMACMLHFEQALYHLMAPASCFEGNPANSIRHLANAGQRLNPSLPIGEL
jgi:pimeloyl-ACP methyl ester carboxylesterase